MVPGTAVPRVASPAPARPRTVSWRFCDRWAEVEPGVDVARCPGASQEPEQPPSLHVPSRPASRCDPGQLHSAPGSESGTRRLLEERSGSAYPLGHPSAS